MLAITIKRNIGVGDALQYSSVPENYFRTTGNKVIDVSQPWFFDHNPYVVRGHQYRASKVIEMWNFSPTQYQWPNPRPTKAAVYLSNAEIWASVVGADVYLNRPRLYKFEEFPFLERRVIYLQTEGKSHGHLPDHIIQHVLEKYGQTGYLHHIGPGNNYGLPSMGVRENLWDLADILSQARMLIGPDSGPAWIASCFPDVVVKKVRVKPNPPEEFKKWIPLEQRNVHSHWDSREHMVYNTSDHDIGFTWSYKRI